MDITIASYTVSQPKGGPLVDITAASYCIAAQGGTIGEHYRSHLLYRSPRGDHWWTLPWPVTVLQPRGTIGEHLILQPLTVSQPKGGPLVDTTMATFCIAAQGGTIGGHHYSQLHCITAQGGTIGEHYRSHLLYRSPRGDHWWTLPWPVTVSQPRGDHW